MKNCNFFPTLYGAPWHLKYLFMALVFTLGSCQKDSISDMMVSENNAAGSTQQLSTARSSDLESEVVEYAQWMIDKVVPLVKDPLVYEDMKAGNFTSGRVTSTLNALGFNGYGDFTSQFALKGSGLNEAVKSGSVSKETLLAMFQQQFRQFDIPALGRMGGSSTTSPETPCYDQLITNLAYVAVSVAIASIGQTPIGAVLTGLVGVATAYSAFYLCLEENYPGGGDVMGY
ncbi:MAG: hypothetical protein IT262_23705 [Saprospiraceae bacterium]|nr:hypothetical protein [Saprospiraceae bacterium]